MATEHLHDQNRIEIRMVATKNWLIVGHYRTDFYFWRRVAWLLAPVLVAILSVTGYCENKHEENQLPSGPLLMLVDGSGFNPNPHIGQEKYHLARYLLIDNSF